VWVLRSKLESLGDGRVGTSFQIRKLGWWSCGYFVPNWKAWVMVVWVLRSNLESLGDCRMGTSFQIRKLGSTQRSNPSTGRWELCVCQWYFHTGLVFVSYLSWFKAYGFEAVQLAWLFIPVCSNKLWTCTSSGIFVIIPDTFSGKPGVRWGIFCLLLSKQGLHSFVFTLEVYQCYKGKGKVIPLQVRCGPEGG